MRKFKRVGKPAQPTQEEKQDYVPLFEDMSEILKRANSDSAEFVVATTDCTTHSTGALYLWTTTK